MSLQQTTWGWEGVHLMETWHGPDLSRLWDALALWCQMRFYDQLMDEHRMLAARLARILAQSR